GKSAFMSYTVDFGLEIIIFLGTCACLADMPSPPPALRNLAGDSVRALNETQRLETEQLGFLRLSSYQGRGSVQVAQEVKEVT
ncbi:MAG: hypothetical protein ACKO96_47260, partial [Flammeovirgaceae bacterium]